MDSQKKFLVNYLIILLKSENLFHKFDPNPDNYK